MPKTNAVVLAGVNLPTLIKLVTMRQDGAAMLEAASEAAASGRKYIQLVTENLAPPVS
jgi:mannose/fructose-specific phosphotransferase system component IIA